MMTPEQEIELFRKQYADKTNTELIMVQHAWLGHASQNIAATQVLEERRLAVERDAIQREAERHEKAGERHSEALAETQAGTVIGKKTLFWTRLAAIIALLALLATLYEILRR